MANGRRRLASGALGAVLLGTAFAAPAQESGGNQSVIGPPQLKDFSLEPRERIVTQPAPQPQRQAPATPPAQAASEPGAETGPRATPPPASVTRQVEAPAATTPTGPAAATDADAPPPSQSVAESGASAIPPVLAEPSPSEPAGAPVGKGSSFWYYALPAAALILLGGLLYRRRRAAFAAAPAVEQAPAAAAAPPPKPRPDPVPRPWLELSLKAERAAFTPTEAEVLFELEIANKGGSAARNLRIDVKMFNAGVEQDKEIGAFFKTAGRESTKLNLPGVEAGVTGVLQGRVTMPVDQMKAMRLDERLLFIPVLAVNALYDWGDGRTGQTSKSYVVGRELQEASDKMGAFRVDQGPRVWRTVGQRPHNLAKRV